MEKKNFKYGSIAENLAGLESLFETINIDFDKLSKAENEIQTSTVIIKGRWKIFKLFLSSLISGKAKMIIRKVVK
jgi:hypothetical protein